MLLAELEEDVRSAVEGQTDDLVLARLVEVTVRAELSGRMLFDNPLHEPVFYAKYFRPWVRAALDERDALAKFHDEALIALGMKPKPGRE